MRDEEMRGVLALPASRRYEHFVRRIVDFETVWGLKGESGWLLVGDDEGNELFPAWPHERYAAEYARVQETAEVPASISLADWIDVWIPRFAQDGLLVAAFPLPTGPGVAVPPQQLHEDIKRELEQYE